MRRSELVVGESYYYATGTGWHNRSGYGKWGRAVVVAVEPHRDPSLFEWRKDPSPRPTTTGNGVVVDLYEWCWDPDVRGDVEPTKPRRTVVQLAHLRGPWEQTKGAVDTATAASHARQVAAADAAEERSQVRQALVDRAAALGLSGVRHDTYRCEITIDTDPLALLLDTYEAGAS